MAITHITNSHTQLILSLSILVGDPC